METEEILNEFKVEVKECDRLLDELNAKISGLNEEITRVEHEIAFVDGRRYMAETFLYRIGG